VSLGKHTITLCSKDHLEQHRHVFLKEVHMAHSPGVSKAIQAALHDINLLRLLVNATDENAANAILSAYRRNLLLRGPDVKAFWISLRDGKMEFSARKLVQYYDILEPKPRVASRGDKTEWNP